MPVGSRYARKAVVTLAARAEAAAALVQARLRARSTRFEKATNVSRPSRIDEPIVARLAAATGYAAARIPGSTCVHRATALWTMLAKRGIDATIRIGHQQVQGQFRAHAWVECAGRAYGEIPGDGLEYQAFADAVVPRRMR